MGEGEDEPPGETPSPFTLYPSPPCQQSGQSPGVGFLADLLLILWATMAFPEQDAVSVSQAPRPRRVLDAPMLLGLSTREGFRTAANSLLEEMAVGNGELVIDLGATREVDSAGLGALVLVQRHASDRRQQVVLRGVGPELEYLLVLTKLDDLFLFEGSEKR